VLQANDSADIKGGEDIIDKVSMEIMWSVIWSSHKDVRLFGSAMKIVVVSWKFTYRTLLMSYCSTLLLHFICVSAISDDLTTAVPSFNAFRELGVAAKIYILWMTEFGKETGECSWLHDTFVLFLSKWSHSSAPDNFKGTLFYLQIVEQQNNKKKVAKTEM